MLIIKRVIAYFIDILIILLYAFALMQITIAIGFDNIIEGPIEGQVVGLISLTIPAFLYLYLSESGKWKATLGKKIMGLQIEAAKNSDVLIRNILKMLPWEIAHTGVHWMLNGGNLDDISMIIWVLLILPQVLVLLYAFGLVRTNGKQTLYDQWAGTEVELQVKK